jgi:hypothetical protein
MNASMERFFNAPSATEIQQIESCAITVVMPVCFRYAQNSSISSLVKGFAAHCAMIW